MARRNKIHGKPIVLPPLGSPQRAALKLAQDPGYVKRRPDGRCSNCGGSGFNYNAACIRGYVCMTCGAIKKES